MSGRECGGQIRDHHEAIVENMADTAFIVDSDWKLEFANETAFSMADTSLEAIEGAPIMGLTEQMVADGERPEKFERALETVYANDPDTDFPVIVELELDLPVGTVTNEYRCSPHSTGDETKAVVVARDITERKERERELREVNDRLELALSGTDTGVWVWDMETDEVDWNESMERLFGLEPGTFEGTFDAFAERVHPEDLPRVEAAIKTAVTEDEMYETEYRIQRDDGEQIWGYARGEIFSSGDSEQMIGIVTDITDRKASEQQYRHLTERITSGYYALDSNWNFTYWNDSMVERQGVTAEEILGENIWDRYPEIEGTVMAETLREAMETGEQTSCEFYYEKMDYWTELQVFSDENGISVLSTDITDRKERERELERQQEFLEQTQDVANIGGWEVDLRSDTLRWTDEVYNIHGLDRDYEPTLEGIPEFYHPEDGETIRNAFERLTTTGESYDLELRIVRPTDEVRWVRTRGEPWYEDGEIVGARGTFQDITDRKERERELQEKRKRLQGLFDEAPDPIFVLDDEGGFIDANRKAAEKLGYSREELLEMETADMDTAVDRSDVRAFLSKVKSEGRTMQIEGRHQRADGSEYPVSVRVTPLETDGQTLFLSHARDITDRKERERELERQQEFLEQTQDVANIGGWEVDLRSETLRWTDEVYNIHGLDRDYEPTLEEGPEFYHPEDRETIRNAFERLTTTGESYDLELRIVRPTDEVRWVRTRGEPWYEDGEIVGARGTFQDITDRKEREQELKKSNERLEQFAYVASHDLQEPLRTISNYTEMLAEDYAEELDADAQRFIDVVVTGSERMQSMIDGLLDYSRVTTRGDEFEPVDAEQIAVDTVEDLEIMLDDHDGTVEVDDLPTVTADGNQLHQVFQNLVKNAIEHSGDDPVTITIRGSEESNQYRFEVEDDGPGIEENRQEKIFRIFKSGEQYQTSSQAKGLGLAICDNIVRRHGGDIWVESEPGNGATFVFTIEKEKTSAELVGTNE